MFQKFFLVFWMLLLVLSFAQAQPQEDQSQVKERIIYIPYHKLESLLEKKDSGIYLPYQDYRKLMDELEKLQSRPPELPASVVISHISYQAKLVDKFLQIEANAHVNVLKEGWHGIELQFGNIALKEALFNDKPALIKLKPNGYELIFQSEKVDKHQLKLVFVVPVKKTHTLSASAEFQVPRAPIANLTVELPLANEENKEAMPKMKVDVNPSLLTQMEYGKDSVVVKSLLGNTDQVQITWQWEAERKVEVKSIVQTDNTSRLEIAENFLQLQSKVVYDVIQGEASSLRLRIPKGFRILSVVSLQGVGIRDWALEGEDILFVQLHDKLVNLGEGKTDLEVEIKLEQIIKKIEEKFALPCIQVLDVEREKGFYIVAVNDLYTLKLLKRQEISQIDIHDLPGSISREDVQFAFKYLKRPFVLEGEMEKKEPEYEVATNVYAYLDENLYKLYAHFQYDIKKSRIFGTKVAIPSGFMILDVKVHDLAEQPKADLIKEYRSVEEQGKTFLMVTFQKGIRSPKLVLRVQLQKKLEQEEKVREILLPVFQVEGAKREDGNIGMEVKPSFNITTIEKTQKNVFPLDTRELFKQGDKPPYSNINNINIGLRYFDHPIVASFRMEKRDPLVTAEVYHYVEVAENVLKSRIQIFYDVQYTGVKEFSFTLPEAIAQEVPKSRVTDAKGLIKEIQIVPDKEKKISLYTVHTQRDILGVFEVRVDYEKKLGQIETEVQEKIFEVVTQNTKRENGFFIFKKDNNLSMDFLSTKGLEVSDINDPTFTRGDKKGVLAIFKYNAHGYELEMSLKKLSFEPVLNTVIQRLHISSTVNKDYTSKNEAVILVINNRKQMLEFEIPEGSRVTSVSRLKSIPNNRYRNMKAYEINESLEALNWSQSDKERRFKVNIATNVQKNAPFVLVIKYESNLKKGEMEFYGDFKLNAIEFVDVPITYFTWDLGLPGEYQYVWFKSNLVKNFSYEYGTWSILSEILDRGGIDTSDVSQEGETGVIPIYPIEGKQFSFYRLNASGYIHATYIYNNWLYTLDLLVFFLVCLFIAVLPKTKLVNRLSLVFFFLGVSILLASFNLQGFQEIYLTVFIGTCVAGSMALIMSFFQKIGQYFSPATAKTHTIYRDKSKEPQVKEAVETQQEKPKTDDVEKK
ncbi:MAG: hypothetical protein HUU50_10630 [Candidatus Brocadiae bacterium]|nr:hypothetical protein [Candidatus Brocadiia bacterium]